MLFRRAQPGAAPKVRAVNCWEHHRCGREPGGAHAATEGVCPVTVETALDGVHGGRNAGRSCWVVAGTMCGGRVQGTFAEKYGSCDRCDFYRQVCLDEGPELVLSAKLLRRLHPGG